MKYELNEKESKRRTREKRMWEKKRKREWK